MKVQTDITSIAVTLIGQNVILVIIYVNTFETESYFIVFIGNVMTCFTSLTNIYQYQSQSVDTDNITQ